MNEVFDFIINSRKAFIKLIDDLTIEELNKFPMVTTTTSSGILAIL